MQLVRSKKKKAETEAQHFNKLLSIGKVLSAFAKLTDTSKGVLSLEQTVKDQTDEQIRIEKLPHAEPISNNYITSCSEDTIPFHSSSFDQIIAQKPRKATMKTPSGLDANEWSAC